MTRTNESTGRCLWLLPALCLLAVEVVLGQGETAPAPGEDRIEQPADEPSPAPEAQSAPEVQAVPVFQLSLTASAWFASSQGYLQTSKGGGAGTTSWKRPELDEIGLDGIKALPVVDARLMFFGHHELHANYVGLVIDGSDTLGNELVSQDVTFPAGSRVDSDLELRMLRFGYRAHWIVPELGGWTLAPEIGLSFYPFQYQLSSPTVADSVDRSYTMMFPYLGVLVSGPIAGKLRGEVEVAGLAGIATLLDVDVRLAYELVEVQSVHLALVAGLKGTWFERRDHQDPQYNSIQLRMGSFSTQPWNGFHVGLRLSF